MNKDELITYISSTSLNDVIAEARNLNIKKEQIVQIIQQDNLVYLIYYK